MQAELRAEQRDTSPAERASLPLLAACIKETMRLNSVATGGSLRQTTRIFSWARILCPRVRAIAHCQFGLIFTSELIREAPDEFRPRR